MKRFSLVPVTVSADSLQTCYSFKKRNLLEKTVYMFFAFLLFYGVSSLEAAFKAFIINLLSVGFSFLQLFFQNSFCCPSNNQAPQPIIRNLSCSIFHLAFKNCESPFCVGERFHILFQPTLRFSCHLPSNPSTE